MRLRNKKRLGKGNFFGPKELKTLFALVFFLLILLISVEVGEAQTNPGAKLFLSPATGGFLVGSTFDVSIAVDTGGTAINAVKVDLSFPADKLQVVRPSSGKSFISIWLEQPTFSNTDGTISFAGGIPEGINTSSGIISTITFRVINPGEAIVRVLASSSVLAHDGKGTEILDRLIDSQYTLSPQPPAGPKVFSQSHPDETRWYNNNNPVISWEKEADVTDFSFLLDVYPQTVPDNVSEGQDTAKAFENLDSGLWYFHIKAQKQGVWGQPSHFLIRIDTVPPASFRPEVELLLAAVISRAFVSFSTTDALSGMDHYEVAVIDRAEPPVGSPVFVEAEGPYQLPKVVSGYFRVIVRAVDKSGNVRDESVDVNFPGSLLVRAGRIALIVVAILVFSYFVFKLARKLKKKIRERKQNREALKNQVFEKEALGQEASEDQMPYNP